MLGPIDDVLKGDNVSLNCSIIEGSTPEIHWSKDNLTRSEKGRMLHLTKVKAEDEGWYTCKAENYAGSSSDRILLTVYGKCITYVTNLMTTHPLSDTL